MRRAISEAATGTLFGVALNYQGLLHSRLEEFQQPPYQKPPVKPVLFIKTPNTRNGDGQAVVFPAGVERLQPGPALGVVLGRDASRVSEDEAMDYVAGYTIVNDVSERDFQFTGGGGQWIKGKSPDTFAPMGPWFVTKDEIPDPQNLNMWLEVDGHRYQNGSTATMIFGVAHLVSHLSRYLTLLPGDVISTGTPPGVGAGVKPNPVFLKAGNVMRVGIEGLGEQRSEVGQA